MADVVLWDIRCVLKGSMFLIDIPWGTSSWRMLCCGTDAVFSREVFLKYRHSLGHLLREDAVLWDARCVLKGSVCSNRHSSGHLLIGDAVFRDARCVLEGSSF